MAFGTRGTVKPGARRRMKPALAEGEGEPTVDDQINDKMHKLRERMDEKIPRKDKKGARSLLMLQLGSVAVVVVMMAVLLYLFAPLTYGASTQRYKYETVRTDQSIRKMSETTRADLLKSAGVDLTGVIKSPVAETSDLAADAARTCFPNRQETVVFPIHVRKGYVAATGFMECVMQVQQARFCFPEARERLVEQLIAYLRIHQHALGLQTAEDAFVEKMASREMTELTGGAPVVRKIDKSAPRIDEAPDPVIIGWVEALNKAGYLLPADFGWGGYFLPAAYADALGHETKRTPRCGGR